MLHSTHILCEHIAMTIILLRLSCGISGCVVRDSDITLLQIISVNCDSMQCLTQLLYQNRIMSDLLEIHIVKIEFTCIKHGIHLVDAIINIYILFAICQGLEVIKAIFGGFLLKYGSWAHTLVNEGEKENNENGVSI